MVFGSFRKKKSKALHKSPVQTLVLQTQGLARATSLNSLNDCSFEERTTRGGSLPPPVPRPSAGAACSTIGSDHEWNDYDAATIQRQRSIKNESNEIVETLKHENAGLKEKIVQLEVSAKTAAAVQSNSLFEKKKKRKEKEENNEITGLNNALEKSLDESRAIHELYVTSENDNKRINEKLSSETKKVETLEMENTTLIETQRKSQQETLLLRQEWDQQRITNDRLSRELFETRFSTSTRINEQEEQILSLERTIRNLDGDKTRLEAQLEIASQKSRDSIALADHEQIIASIRLDFANKLKEQQKNELEHGETIKRKNQEIGRLQDQIEDQIRQKGEVEAYAESQRQDHAEKMARVNPVFVENDGLKNQNQLLLKQVQSLSRQLDDAQRHVTILESQSHRYRSYPNRENQQSVEVRHALNSIKSDWRNVVSLLAEVEDEKRKNEHSLGFLYFVCKEDFFGKFSSASQSFKLD